MTLASLILTKGSLPLREAAKLFPCVKGGRPLHPSTLSRWILRGVRVPGGGRVHLQAARCGATWVTNREAIETFLEAISARPGAPAAPPPRTATQRSRADAAAGRVLDRAGIK